MSNIGSVYFINFMTQKKGLVTGGAGFIGSNFCNKFSEKYDLVALDNLFLGSEKNLKSSTPFFKGDACVLDHLERCGNDFDFIFHLAGTSSAPMFTGESFFWAYQNAIESFAQVLNFAQKNGVKKILYASTSSLYGNNPMPLTEDQSVTPINHYAVTKFCYEHMARCFHQVYPDVELVGFRFMSVYGPNEEEKGPYANMISQFIWDIARKKSPIIYGDGNQFRDFTHVDDILQGVDLAISAEKPLGNKVYNIGRGESTSFNEIFSVIRSVLQSEIEPTYIPNPVKEGYVKGQHADITNISSDLGYAPRVQLKQGIADLIKDLQIDRIRETSSDLLRKK